jgi:hypothetical protein
MWNPMFMPLRAAKQQPFMLCGVSSGGSSSPSTAWLGHTRGGLHNELHRTNLCLSARTGRNNFHDVATYWCNAIHKETVVCTSLAVACLILSRGVPYILQWRASCCAEVCHMSCSGVPHVVQRRAICLAEACHMSCSGVPKSCRGMSFVLQWRASCPAGA